jgi:integrase/recombinase XerD
MSHNCALCVVCAVCVVYTCTMNTLPTITRAVTIPSPTDVNLFAEYLLHRDLRPHTMASYVSAWRRIVTDLGGQTITTAAIAAWRDSLLAQGRSPLSVNVYLSVVRLFSSWCASCGVSADVAAGVRGVKADKYYRRDPLSAVEAAAVLRSASSTRTRLMVELELRAGMRGVELHRANVGDRQTRHGRDVLMVQGKGRDVKDQMVILCPATCDVWDQYLAERGCVRPTDPLLVNSTGRRLTTRQIRRLVTDTLVTAKVKCQTVTAHSLRHTTADLLIRSGRAMADVQQVLRHSSIDSTQIYTRRAQADARLTDPVEYTLQTI